MSSGAAGGGGGELGCGGGGGSTGDGGIRVGAVGNTTLVAVGASGTVGCPDNEATDDLLAMEEATETLW